MTRTFPFLPAKSTCFLFLSILQLAVLIAWWFDFGNITTTLRAEYATLRDIIGPIRLTKSDIFFLFIRKIIHDVMLEWQANPRSIQSPTLVVTTAVILWLLAVFASALFTRSSDNELGIPVLQRQKGVSRSDYEAILKEGKRKYPDTPYIITYSGYQYIVYPSSSFDEVKRLPMAKASLIEWATHVFFQGWRFLGSDHSVLHKVIAADLWRAVPGTVWLRQSYAQRAVQTAIGNSERSEEWRSLRLYSTVQNIIVRTNGVSFMGEDLGTNKLWLWAVQLLPMVCMVGVLACHGTPRWLRPIVASVVFLPAWCIYWLMEALVLGKTWREMWQRPQVKLGKDGDVANARTSNGFPITAWLLQRYPPEERSLRQIGRDYINISFESTTATSATLYFILAELAARPELVQQLRDELVLHTDVDGKLPQTSLEELQKLDSVMRESQRINTFSYLTLYRRVSQPLKLSVGPEIPRGSLICVDAYDLVMSKGRWGNPETFDPMRFYKLRQEAANLKDDKKARTSSTSHYLFTSLGPDNPGFGDGPQACPGRRYAGNTIKIILCELLMTYDIRLDPKAVQPRRYCMPSGSFVPDMKARVLFRKRKKE